MGTTTTNAAMAYRSVVRIHPANLREEDTLCGEDGRPFAVVSGHPGLLGNAVWVDTVGFLPIEFPVGTSALILARTVTSNER